MRKIKMVLRSISNVVKRISTKHTKYRRKRSLNQNMSSKSSKGKMAELSISGNPSGSQLFKKCKGLPKSKPQKTDDADTGVKVMSNTVKKPSSETNSGKKTTLSKFTLKSSNTNNVIIYTSNLQKLGEFLSDYNLNHNKVQVQPRGLVNRSTRCYVNATLQALLMCPPFYNLMESISLNFTDVISCQKRSKSRTPVIESIVKFIREFEFEDNTLFNTQEVLNPGAAFDPFFVYKILPTFEDGYQEDAEEFMSHLLNCINDEMAEVIQLSKAPDDAEPTEVQWKIVNRRHKMKTRVTMTEKTPLTKIFRGHIRTRTVLNDNELTDNIEPFFTLKLDIEKAKSVAEAMHTYNAKITLEGLKCSTNSSGAYQQITIDELPYVLILHIKCFEYKEKKLTKIIKDFQFAGDLKIEPKLLSKKSKKNMKKRNYKLFAVVCHDGKEATNGHYYADVFYADLGRWLRFDDSTVRYVTDAEVYQPKHLTMPYLLYYIRANPAEESTAAGNPAER